MQGQAVKHISFGEGIIKNVSGRFITICFAQGDKKFLYPDAFSRFLKLKDAEKQKELEEKNKQRMTKKKAERKKEQERRWKIYTMKIVPNSQAAFHIEFQDAENIVECGRVSTGCYLSGASKGNPRIPRRLKPNSVCLITGLPKDKEERNRRILGAFMVKGDFLGEYCEDGIVKGHEQYKVYLHSDETLPFWDYFKHDETFPRWGNVPFKYFSNTTMQKILSDITKLLAGTTQEAVVHEFYQYFCKLNHLSAEPTNQGDAVK